VISGEGLLTAGYIPRGRIATVTAETDLKISRLKVQAKKTKFQHSRDDTNNDSNPTGPFYPLECSTSPPIGSLGLEGSNF
jgi:hypothetical protein